MVVDRRGDLSHRICTSSDNLKAFNFLISEQDVYQKTKCSYVFVILHFFRYDHDRSLNWFFSKKYFFV